MNRITTRLLINFQSSLIINRFQSTSAISVIGAAFNNGQPKPGTEQGPGVLRANQLITKLDILHPGRVVDFGDINFNINSFHDDDELNLIDGTIKLANKNEYLMFKMCQRLSQTVAKAIKRGFTPLVIGGDHSIALGSVMGTCQAMPNDCISVIWVDAHADVNTEKTSPTGNYHGMPVSFLIRDIDASEQRRLLRMPCLDAKNIIYIGLRDVDWEELQLLKKYNIAYFTMNDVDRLGIREVVSRALDIVNPHNNRKLHVSFDVDSVDDSLIASTGTPVPGGLTIREAITLAEMISDTQQMVALDVVEFNPKLGNARQVNQSSNYIINHYILSFFGKSRIGLYHNRKDSKE